MRSSMALIPGAEFFQYSYDFSKRYDFPGLPILPSIGLEAQF